MAYQLCKFGSLLVIGAMMIVLSGCAQKAPDPVSATPVMPPTDNMTEIFALPPRPRSCCWPVRDTAGSFGRTWQCRAVVSVRRQCLCR